MMKKKVDFKFHLNGNIEWHCMQLEFNSIQWIKIPKCNSNSIELDSNL